MIYTNTRTLHHSNLRILCMKQVQCTVNQARIFVSDATMIDLPNYFRVGNYL